jgi:hypothetical protein
VLCRCPLAGGRENEAITVGQDALTAIGGIGTAEEWSEEEWSEEEWSEEEWSEEEWSEEEWSEEMCELVAALVDAHLVQGNRTRG